MEQQVSSLERQAEELAQRGEWGASAEAVNRQIIELVPGQPAAYTRLARCLKDRGDFSSAEAIYRQVLTFDPTNAIASNNVGRIDYERAAAAAANDQSRQRLARIGQPGDTSGSGGRRERATLEPTGVSESEDLRLLHQQLAAHFAELREQRMVLGAPIFALEHGLSDAELVYLKAAVGSAVLRGDLPRYSWLPFVVYAAEIGYEYSGEEYWQTFEARTPSWVNNGDRNYIRHKFREFRGEFGGAEPSGNWAVQFSIICWPITHAVLPTDLQRQLARILFEYRRALTSTLLEDPAELGARLAARTWHASSRFQTFAQNTTLLGHVAVALLLSDDSDSALLLPSTLSRIVADLSEEREAWRMLRGAKASANLLRLHGFRPGERDPSRLGSTSAEPLSLAPDPKISLRNENGWTAYLRMPDLSLLAERLPEVHQEGARLRPMVLGYSGPPLARGRLAYPGRPLRLNEWPSPGSPLIQLERGSEAVNSLLADQCVISPGPLWLFHVRDDREAIEVRGKFVRPGHAYVAVSVERLPDGMPTWVSLGECQTAGIHAYNLLAPDVLDLATLGSLRAAGLSTITDVEIRPAGLVPASWDGEGAAEWVPGDNPIVAVSSSRAVSRCVATLDDVPHIIQWPAPAPEILLGIDGLDVGMHSLQISLFSSEGAQQIAEGSLAIVIRSPSAPPVTGSFREALMLLPTPAAPTLTEVWDGTASIEVVGPDDIEVSVDMSLAARPNRVLATRQIRVVLPVAGTDWTGLLAEFRDDDQIRRFYDQAESAQITVSHPNLGTVALRLEREFSPLRWIAGRDGDTPYLQLVNNTANAATVEVLEFAFPDHLVSAILDADLRVSWAAGGLVTAKAETALASTLLSPRVRGLDELDLLTVKRLEGGSRTVDEIRRLILLARRWASGSLTGDPLAAAGRTHVQRAIAGQIGALIGGGRWTALELRASRAFDEIHTSEIEHAIGDAPPHRALARQLLRDIHEILPLAPPRRARRLARMMATHVPAFEHYRGQFSFAEFVLRLASDPPSLADLPGGELAAGLANALISPVVVRASRFIVLAVDAWTETDTGSIYRGWSWA
jgi:tetratricopeptide (TPR) repeat protein